MSRSAGRRGLVGGLLTAITLIAGATMARAEPALGKWTMEVGVAAGGSISFDFPPSHDESIAGFHLMPRVGLVLTDETGQGWLRGNLELLAEPMVIRLEGDRSSATVGGMAALARWVFVGTGRVHPYLEGGAGVLVGPADLDGARCDVNFALAGGPGLMLFVSDTAALTLGYRLHHISNAHLCSPNPGLNSSLFLVGLSYFFP